MPATAKVAYVSLPAPDDDSRTIAPVRPLMKGRLTPAVERALLCAGLHGSPLLDLAIRSHQVDRELQMKERGGPRYILAPWADTENMTRATKSTAQRHHWLNTIVGILDAAFHLSEEEQFQVITVVRQVLEALRIPERGAAHSLPAPVALEIASAYYTVQLSHARNSGAVRPVRQAQAGDMVVSAEAWRDAIVGMISSAYPDLAPEERLFTAKVVADLLAALGVPYRAAAFFPDAVVRAYHASPEATASYLR